MESGALVVVVVVVVVVVEAVELVKILPLLRCLLLGVLNVVIRMIVARRYSYSPTVWAFGARKEVF